MATIILAYVVRKKMKYCLKTVLTIFFLSIAVHVYGQDGDDDDDSNLTVEAGADLVSSYVWRGMYQAGTSLQPSLSLSAYGFTLGSWASSDFGNFLKEVDFYIAYETKRFTVGIMDYWCRSEGDSFFKDRQSHLFEANLGYTFSERIPLSLEINTMFAGEDDRNDDGKQLYSTYIAARYPFPLKNVDCEIGIGITPMNGMYYNKFHVANITVKASKNLHFSSVYALPLFVELSLSPAQDSAFLVFGVSF